jgi:hypothetical protein
MESKRKQLWAGRIVSAVPVLFLLMDGGMKLFKPSFVVKATTELGFPESTIVGIGTALLASVILHLVPRTSFLGALLITAYLGGAREQGACRGTSLRHYICAHRRDPAVGWVLAARAKCPRDHSAVPGLKRIFSTLRGYAPSRRSPCHFRHTLTTYKQKRAKAPLTSAGSRRITVSRRAASSRRA